MTHYFDSAKTDEAGRITGKWSAVSSATVARPEQYAKAFGGVVRREHLENGVIEFNWGAGWHSTDEAA